MCLARLKLEAERLSPKERRHLAAHLVALEQKVGANSRRELARKISDRSPGRWMTLKAAEKRLAK
jgi:hypothetical protein